MTHAEETIAAAAQLDHPWDARALDWPLTHDSVVVEVGGYKGRWALQIAERYAPRLYVFEPQRWAAEVCRDVLHNRAFIMDLALGTTTGPMLMGEWETDGCSLVKDGAEYQVKMWEISDVFRYLKIDHIDLMLINIEGYEYTLIPHMLERDIRPQRLMVQFHTFADPSGVATGRIYDQLAAAGYAIAWSYGVVLTAWERA
jgi:FkbM family methyltransferase